MKKLDFALARVLGPRSFIVFSLVTLLVVAILAAVNITSRYALKRYVDDQLQRIAWDVSAYQTGDVGAVPAIADALAGTAGVSATNTLLFLRNSMTTEDIAYIDGRPIRMPWLSLLTASDIGILPAGIRPPPNKAVFVLVGTKAQMGNAYADLQGAKHFEIRIEDVQHGGSHQHETPPGGVHADPGVKVFEIGLESTIRIERKDLNRWFLEQTSSPALIPEVGAILVAAYDDSIVDRFDAMARGIVTAHHDGDIHEEAGSYFPDIVHLLKVDTTGLVSGWDIERSVEALDRLQGQLEINTFAVGPRVFVDNSTAVLLERMARIARQVGLISLLIAIPLIWVGWILMANLSRMLLLNERRKVGLLRMRGAPGPAMGRAVQMSIGAGAFVGGALGAVAGTLIPLRLYAGEQLPLETVLKVQQPWLLAVFVLIGMIVALGVSRNFVRQVSVISPLAASERVSSLPAGQARRRFAWPETVALLLGGYKLIAWMAGWSVAAFGLTWLTLADRALDFIGFPLFVYGLTMLLVSSRWLMSGVLRVIVAFIGGPLKGPVVKHISTRPQRVAGFLLIVAMMTTIGLYPTVMTAVFEDKLDRGTRIQIGSDIQLSVNAPDIVDNELLARGGIQEQYAALRRAVPDLTATLSRIDGVRSATWSLIQGVSDGVYVPGYGFNGLPIYFVPDAGAYLSNVEHENTLAPNGDFSGHIESLPSGRVLLSPAVASFSERNAGERMPLGRDTGGSTMVDAEVGGAVWYLPGSPLVSVTDRESFDAARIDYVNYLFTNNAYVVVDPVVEAISDLDVLISGVQIAVNAEPGTDLEELAERISGHLPVEPSSMRVYDQEIERIGSDMYIFLARQNLRIYLLGGLFLSLVGILAVAYTNYLEDRRTLALLRVRGAGPRTALRFFGAGIFAPSIVGLVIGAAVALIAGFGMTNLIWQLRPVKNILTYLETHLAISTMTIAIAVALFVIVGVVGVFFSQWAFRKTAREGLSEA